MFLTSMTGTCMTSFQVMNLNVGEAMSRSPNALPHGCMGGCATPVKPEPCHWLSLKHCITDGKDNSAATFEYERWTWSGQRASHDLESWWRGRKTLTCQQLTSYHLLYTIQTSHHSILSLTHHGHGAYRSTKCFGFLLTMILKYPLNFPAPAHQINVPSHHILQSVLSQQWRIGDCRTPPALDTGSF